MKKLKLFTIFLTITILSQSAVVQAQEKTHVVLFSSAIDSIENLEKIKLNKFLKSTNSITIHKILIQGFCSDVGSLSYNKDLSTRRANTVEIYLANVITEETIIIIESKGEIPLSTKSLKDKTNQRANNRIVKITINPRTKKKPKNYLSDNVKEGDIMVLEGILFYGGTSNMNESAHKVVRNLIEELKANKQYDIRILGHVCCATNGDDGLDLITGIKNLSVARAKEVYNRLILGGINPERLSYKGMKSNYKTGKAAHFDRRVEIKIMKVN